MEELSYRNALKKTDKGSVLEVTASSGAIDRIVEFCNLKRLDLSGNKEVKDFTFLKELPNLEELAICEMELNAIPSSIEKLKKLRSLFLSGNPITDFSLLLELPELDELGMESLGLKKVPVEIPKIKKLRILGLFNNSIQSLTALTKLTNLEKLYISDNRVKKVPKDFKKLTKLKEFYFFNNIPEDLSVLGEMPSLEVLSLRGAGFVEGIFELPNLKKLSIALWHTDPLPCLLSADISKMNKLEEFTIAGSGLKVLPKKMSTLKNLELLHLSGNTELKDISTLHDLPKLKDFMCSSSKVEKINENFSSLKALTKITMDVNSELTKIEGLRDLPELEELSLDGFFEDISGIGTLTKLKKLSLRGAPKDVDCIKHLIELEDLFIKGRFEEMPSTMKKITRLIIIRNKGKDDFLSGFPLLEELELIQTSVKLPILSSLKSLKIADIEGELELNNLKKMEKLERFELCSSDGVVSIPDSISQAKSLKQIEFSFLSQLNDISALKDLPLLESLEICGSDTLKALPESLKTLTALRELSIHWMDELVDIKIVGALRSLEKLSIKDCGILSKIPDLALLEKLEEVELDSLVELTNLDAFSQLTSLKKFVCKDCYEIKRKAITKIENIIDQSHHSLITSYSQFIDEKRYESLKCKEDKEHTYDFPLLFAPPEVLADLVEDFAWLEEFDEDDDADSEFEEERAILDGTSPLKMLAVLDLDFPGCEDVVVDSYSEEMFLVDTESSLNAVFIWGHDGVPVKTHDTFDDFLLSLVDFSCASLD